MAEDEPAAVLTAGDGIGNTKEHEPREEPIQLFASKCKALLEEVVDTFPSGPNMHYTLNKTWAKNKYVILDGRTRPNVEPPYTDLLFGAYEAVIFKNTPTSVNWLEFLWSFSRPTLTFRLPSKNKQHSKTYNEFPAAETVIADLVAFLRDVDV
jgi:hypothetical protein